METAKSHARRQREGWFDRYIVAPVIDIGGGRDLIVPDARVWDLQFGDGDATDMAGAPDGYYATVYASHVLEHLADPIAALRNWWRILRPGGRLIVAVPHRDLYEQRRELPSNFNHDHKTFWLPFDSEPPVTLSLFHTLRTAIPACDIRMIRVLNDGYVSDGVNHATGEYSIEAIIEKRA